MADYLNLPKNCKKINSSLITLDDNSVIAGRDLEVTIPERFIENSLARVTDFVDTISVLGFVLPNDCFSSFVSFLRVKMFPSEMNDVVIDGKKYISLLFQEGDTVIENLNVSVDPNMPYHYFMEFVNYAKIPWYMDYKVHSTLFDSALAELGKQVGSTPQVMRLIYSYIYRDPDDPEKPYRLSKAKKEGRPPIIVGLNNPSMLIEDSFSRFLGGYLSDKTLSAIIKPSDKVTNLDRMMRGVPTDVE